MHLKSLNRIAAVGAVVISGASLSQAEVTVSLEGNINELSGGAIPPNGFFEVGDPILLTFTFNEFTNGFQIGATRRTDAMKSFSGSVGGYTFGGSTGDIFLRNDGISGGIFDGNPFDQIGVNFQNELVNQGALGIDRNDFDFDSGSVGGFRLRSVGFNVQTDNTNMLDGLDFSQDAFGNAEDFLDQYFFRMTFSNEAFGTTPALVRGSFTSITVTPTPSSFAMISLAGLCASRRRR